MAKGKVVSLEEKKKNAKRITKADVLATTEKVEEEYIEALDLVVPMRRLDDVEATDVQTSLSSGVEVSRDAKGEVKDMKIDIPAQVAGERYGRREAIAHALSVEGEEYSVEEIEKFPANYVTEISNRVFELSGMNQEQQEEIKSVREKRGRSGDSVDAPTGSSAGE